MPTNLEVAGQGVYDLVGADMSENMDRAAIRRLELLGLNSPVWIELLSCADGRTKHFVDVQRGATGL
jgi:hypothetical protein